MFFVYRILVFFAGSMMKQLMQMLKEKDPACARKLEEQELKPQYYAFRYLTLLLSQEFPLPGQFWLYISFIVTHKSHLLIKKKKSIVSSFKKKWLYNCLVECCFQDFFKMVHSIHVYFPSRLFFKLFVKVQDWWIDVYLIELNSVLMLNWIVWNRAIYMYKNRFSLK